MLLWLTDEKYGFYIRFILNIIDHVGCRRDWICIKILQIQSTLPFKNLIDSVCKIFQCILLQQFTVKFIKGCILCTYRSHHDSWLVTKFTKFRSLCNFSSANHNPWLIAHCPGPISAPLLPNHAAQHWRDYFSLFDTATTKCHFSALLVSLRPPSHSASIVPLWPPIKQRQCGAHLTPPSHIHTVPLWRPFDTPSKSASIATLWHPHRTAGHYSAPLTPPSHIHTAPLWRPFDTPSHSAIMAPLRHPHHTAPWWRPWTPSSHSASMSVRSWITPSGTLLTRRVSVRIMGLSSMGTTVTEETMMKRRRCQVQRSGDTAS